MSEQPTTEYTRDTIIAAARDGSFESLCRKAGLELDEPDWERFVQTAAELQRRGEIDLIRLAGAGQGPVDYYAERLYQAAFSELDVPARVLLGAASALATRTDDGTVPYFMFDAFANYAAKDPERVEAALIAIGTGAAPESMLIATLQAGLRAKRDAYLPLVATMMVSGADKEVSAAGFVLGTVEAANEEEGTIIGDALSAAITSGRALSRVAAFKAGLVIGTRDTSSEGVANSVIDGIGTDITAEMRTAAANALFLARKIPSEALVARICDVLRATEKGETSTVAAIDYAIAQHLTGPTAAPRLDLLQDLLKRGVAKMKGLQGTTHYILQNKGNLLATMMVNWIADGSDQLIGAVHDVLFTPATDRPLLNLDFTGSSLTAEQTLASARKIVSRLILFPVTAASIVLSLMRSGHADAADGLEELLYDPLLISYWDPAREYLTNASPKQPPQIQDRIARLLKTLDNHIEAIKDVGFIDELRPSERQRFLQQVMRLEEHAKIQKSATKNSIFADLIPTSVMLYGDSVVSEVHLGDGQTQRREFRLGVVEHSMELASLDAIDPVGFWYQRLVLSMGKQA
jgi:hypothetical protein